jgi:hypothetical protein
LPNQCPHRGGTRQPDMAFCLMSGASLIRFDIEFENCCSSDILMVC